MKKITFLMICLMATFFASAQITSMAIVGNGTIPNGWPGESGNPGPTDLFQMTSTDGITWTYDNLVTYDGAIKFRANNTWDPNTLNWGGNTFPTGAGIVDGPAIGSTVGVYDVTFNTTTLEYSFVSQNLYPIIGLIGPGTPGASWDTGDTDLSTSDGIHYSINNVMLSGAVKFRKNHTWTADGNWAPLTFPSGIAILNDSGALEVPAGLYNVSFNLETLAYSFSFPSIAIVGSATPQGEPISTTVDEYVLTTTDGINYALNSIVITDGWAKFREDSAWAHNWGAASFPSGTATQDGTNITCTAGTYSVTFNRSTGDYAFNAPIASIDNFEMNKLNVYPNPTQNSWNFVSANETIDSIVIIDMLGKTVLSIAGKNNEQTIDASGLSNGVYIAKISTSKGINTMKLVKN
jgi:hypothetical protein